MTNNNASQATDTTDSTEMTDAATVDVASAVPADDTVNTSGARTITPFRMQISDADLADLRARLRNTRLPVPLPGDDWDTGVPISYLTKLVGQWAEFDWRGYEARLNEIPQFTTEIDGQSVHFVQVRSGVSGAVPLLLTHGWPGSYLEFLDLIGPLTDPAAHGGNPDDAFDVVIPSIPGFGFSTPLASAGWTTERIARAWVELMDRLGYQRFAVQGGDMGGGISPEIGRLAPEKVLGVHINGAFGYGNLLDDDAKARLTPLEQDRLRRIDEFMRTEFGYIALQGTRPGLVGAMLADSPVGQLAWIVDKLRAWTHPLDVLPEDVVGLDFVLGNASLYWFTACAGSAAYVGYAQDAQDWGSVPANSGVPTASLQFAHDVGIRAADQVSNTIVRWTDIADRGGHFAALEQPETLIGDVREFLRPLR